MAGKELIGSGRDDLFPKVIVMAIPNILVPEVFWGMRGHAKILKIFFL